MGTWFSPRSRPRPAVGAPRARDVICLSFFSMTRAFRPGDVLLLSRQAVGLMAARVSRARYPVIRHRGGKHVRPQSAFFFGDAPAARVIPGRLRPRHPPAQKCRGGPTTRVVLRGWVDDLFLRAPVRLNRS